jgi:tetratricopeptide (TPR) repeat protein
LQDGRFDAAGEILAHNPPKYKSEARRFSLRAMLEYCRGKYKEAANICKEGLGYSPENFDLHVNLAAAYQGLSDHMNAVDVYLKAMPLAPDEAAKAAILEIIRQVYLDGQDKPFPYYIHALPYRNSSSGIRCLYYLCSMLNNAGYEAYILNGSQAPPQLNAPLLTPATIKKHSAEGRMPIYVFFESSYVGSSPTPELVIARWLLNKAGHVREIEFARTGVKQPEAIFRDDELFFYTEHCFVSGEKNAKRLRMYPVDFTNYYPPEAEPERKGIGYYAQKYLSAQYEVCDYVIENYIDLGLKNPKAPEELGEIFRKLKALYVFEPTGTLAEALLCHCPGYIVDTPYMAEFKEGIEREGIYCMVSEDDIVAGNVRYEDYNFEAFDKYVKDYVEQMKKDIAVFCERTQSAMCHLLTQGTLDGFEPDKQSKQGKEDLCLR